MSTLNKVRKLDLRYLMAMAALTLSLLLIVQATPASAAPPAEAETNNLASLNKEYGPFISKADDGVETYVIDPAVFMEDEYAEIQASEQITLLTQAQADQLISETFGYAADVFGALISIIAIGAGIQLGFRIAREVRGFLSG